MATATRQNTPVAAMRLTTLTEKPYKKSSFDNTLGLPYANPIIIHSLILKKKIIWPFIEGNIHRLTHETILKFIKFNQFWNDRLYYKDFKERSSLLHDFIQVQMGK